MDTDSATNVLLAEEDLLRTYPEDGNPIETVDQYREALELRNADPNRSRASISRAVGRPSSTLRRWLVDDSKPAVIKALETANERGWIPLHADDRAFESINPLLAWIYAGGLINPETFEPSLTINTRLQRAVAGPLLEHLNIEWRSIREERTEERTHELRPRAGGAVLGRVLYALGAPKGRKTEQDISLPAYLDHVSPHHRRVFARVYLLHRGAPANEDGFSLTVQEERRAQYFHELQSLFEDVTNEKVTLDDSIPKLYLSKAAVQNLAGDGLDPYLGLAYHLAYGENGSIVTERSFVNAYGSSYRNPWTVLQAYREVKTRQRDEGDSINKRQLARDVGMKRSNVHQWLDGRSPYAVNGLEAAHERGWIGFEPSGTTFLLLNRLVAWVFAAGYIDASTHQPRFLVRTDDHIHLLEDIFEALAIETKTRLSDKHREVLPRTDGPVLGRVLHVMGVPYGELVSNPLLSLPIYLERATEAIRRDFAIVYLSNRRRKNVPPSDGLTLYHPKASTGYLDDLYMFYDHLSEGGISRGDQHITLSRAAVQSLVPEIEMGSPDESILFALRNNRLAEFM